MGTPMKLLGIHWISAPILLLSKKLWRGPVVARHLLRWLYQRQSSLKSITHTHQRLPCTAIVTGPSGPQHTVYIYLYVLYECVCMCFCRVCLCVWLSVCTFVCERQMCSALLCFAGLCVTVKCVFIKSAGDLVVIKGDLVCTRFKLQVTHTVFKMFPTCVCLSRPSWPQRGVGVWAMCWESSACWCTSLHLFQTSATCISCMASSGLMSAPVWRTFLLLALPWSVHSPLSSWQIGRASCRERV